MNVRDAIIEPLTRSRSFLEECWAELKKVHFPTRRETQAATVVVVVGVIAAAVYIAVVDAALSWVIKLFLV